MAYCMYVRKSREDEEAELRGEGETLARHTDVLLGLAKRRHLEIGKIYKEIVSGDSISARPEMTQLLADVESGMWEGVLCYDITRLARGDSIDQGYILKVFQLARILVITPSRDYNPNNDEDEEYFEFGLFMSRREYKTTKRRTMRGRLISAKEGKYVNSRAPYGYNRIKIPNDKGYTLEINPEQAETVKMIFDWYDKGELQEDGQYYPMPLRKMARKLDAMNIKPMFSESWNPASLREILLNPIYIGKIQRYIAPSLRCLVSEEMIRDDFKRRSKNQSLFVDGVHPAIIEEDVFYRVKSKFDNHKTPLPVKDNTEITNPFAGVGYCGLCGRALTVGNFKINGRSGAPRLQCPRVSCSNKSADLAIVEAKILEYLKKRLNDYTLDFGQSVKEENKAAIVSKENTLKRMIKEGEKLQKQLDKTYDFLEKEVYTLEVFLERSRKISEKMEDNKNGCDLLKKQIENEKQAVDEKAVMAPKITHLLDVYENLPTIKAKNDLMRSVIYKFTYVKLERSKQGELDNFELVIYPNIPSRK